jgi:thioredoxin reductase
MMATLSLGASASNFGTSGKREGSGASFGVTSDPLVLGTGEVVVVGGAATACSAAKEGRPSTIHIVMRP